MNIKSGITITKKTNVWWLMQAIISLVICLNYLDRALFIGTFAVSTSLVFFLTWFPSYLIGAKSTSFLPNVRAIQSFIGYLS